MAPAWWIGNADLAYHTVLDLRAWFSAAAFPAYALARQLGISTVGGLAVAVLTVLVPDVAFATNAMTEPYAYPIFLGTLLAAVKTIVAPTRRRQAAVVVLMAGLCLARVQFVFSARPVSRSGAHPRTGFGPASAPQTAAGSRRGHFRGRGCAGYRRWQAGRVLLVLGESVHRLVGVGLARCGSIRRCGRGRLGNRSGSTDRRCWTRAIEGACSPGLCCSRRRLHAGVDRGSRVYRCGTAARPRALHVLCSTSLCACWRLGARIRTGRPSA